MRNFWTINIIPWSFGYYNLLYKSTASVNWSYIPFGLGSKPEIKNKMDFRLTTNSFSTCILSKYLYSS